MYMLRAQGKTSQCKPVTVGNSLVLFYPASDSTCTFRRALPTTILGYNTSEPAPLTSSRGLYCMHEARDSYPPRRPHAADTNDTRELSGQPPPVV